MVKLIRPSVLAVFVVLVVFATLLIPRLAQAGPGWELTSFTTAPRDAPKLVAAVNTWMAGPGKTYPGRIVLQAHEADGSDPATHSIVALFDSVAGGVGSASHIVSVGYASQAEMESWSKTLAGNADFARFMSEIRAASDYHGANMVGNVASWGSMPMAEVVGR